MREVEESGSTGAARDAQTSPEVSPENLRRAWAYYWGGILALVAAFAAHVAYRIFKGTHHPVPGLITIVAFWILLTYGLRWLRVGRRMYVAAELPAASVLDPVAVLYLRAFAEDRVTGEDSGSALAESMFGVWNVLAIKTEEEQLAAVMAGIGPMVAVGRPGERLPQLGARRLYVQQCDWQPIVSKLIRESAIVVIRLSATRSVVWELTEAVAAREPSHILLLVSQSRRKYLRLKAALDPVFPKGLPPYRRGAPPFGSLKGVIRFGADWMPRFERVRPRFFRARITAPLEAGLAMALQPVLRRYAFDHRNPGFTWYGVVGAIVSGVMALEWIRVLAS